MRRHLLATLGLGVMLTLAACGGTAATKAPSAAPAASQPPAGSPPAASGNAVAIVDFSFDRSSLPVKVGSTVTWSNTGSATHTVAWDDGSQGSGPLTSGGAAYTRTFTVPGTYAYHCGIHASMKGTIVVAP